MKKIVVLISGSGSNLQAIIDNLGSDKISAVISNVANAHGLKRAELAGIATHIIESKVYQERQIFEQALRNQIEQYQPDLIVMAGFMRILTRDFVQHFQGRLLNIHPSLLPKYPGLNTYRQALAQGDKEHGTTVHFVTEQLDGGPVILQAKVPIFADDQEEDIRARVLTQEHQIYPLVIKWFLSGRLKMHDNAAWLDNMPLPLQGYANDEE